MIDLTKLFFYSFDCCIYMNVINYEKQVKSVKFKSTILEIAANHQSIVVTFSEKIAVFDAKTLEDRLTITTCYPSPSLSPNPIAIGTRWLAYAERKLIPSKRSAGGCDCDGVSSYTATVLNAAKTLSKGLRELGEQVAAGLTGTTTSNVGTTSMNPNASIGQETQQSHPGIITIIDIKVFSDDKLTLKQEETLVFVLVYSFLESN